MLMYYKSYSKHYYELLLFKSFILFACMHACRLAMELRLADITGTHKVGFESPNMINRASAAI